MRMTKIGLKAVALGFALCAGQAAAATYTLNLTGGTPSVSTNDDGFNTVTTYSFTVSGLPDVHPSIEVGDELVINLTFADGAITLPATSYIDVTSFYLTGDGFPSGDSATFGTTTLYVGGIGSGSVVSSGSEGDLADFGTTTSGGVASNQVFGLGVPAMTFDSVSTDFFIQQIDGSLLPGAFGTVDNVSFSADSRSLDPTVPEPATWALMLLGFAGLGAALRARRRIAMA